MLPLVQRMALAAMVGKGSPAAAGLAGARRGDTGTVLDLVAEKLSAMSASVPVLQRLYAQGWTWPAPACEKHSEATRPPAARAPVASNIAVKKRPAPDSGRQQPPQKVQRAAPTTVCVKFEGEGALGLSFRKESIPPVLGSIRKGSLAEAHAPPLRPGLVLSKVAGKSVLTGGTPKPPAVAVAAEDATEGGSKGRSTRSAPGQLMGTLSSVEADATLTPAAGEAEDTATAAGESSLPLSYAECIALIKAASRPIEMEFSIPDDSPRGRQAATAGGSVQPVKPLVKPAAASELAPKEEPAGKVAAPVSAGGAAEGGGDASASSKTRRGGKGGRGKK